MFHLQGLIQPPKTIRISTTTTAMAIRQPHPLPSPPPPPPDEAEIIYKIFDLYEQYDSLTMTETELLRQGIKTKTGRSFTRFSIKSILQNPVYLIADKDAYPYFEDNEAELFSPEPDFDGVPAGSQEKGQVLLHRLQ